MSRFFTTEVLSRAVERQGHQCGYCMLPFGSVVRYKGETVQTAVGDHFVPHSYVGLTLEENLIASCQVCNGLKGDTHFESLEQARRDMLVLRVRRGVDTFFIPSVALTLDPTQWGREYTAYMSEVLS